MKNSHSIRRQLNLTLGVIATLTCIIAGFACFLQAVNFVEKNSVANEARFIEERGRQADVPFNLVAMAHRTAEQEYQKLRKSLSDEQIDKIFDQTFEGREDGTHRMPAKFFDGAVVEGKDYNGFAGYMSARPMSAERKRSVIAGLEAIRIAGASFHSVVDSLALALPDDDLVIFAPNRPDRMSYYRDGAPPDFGIWEFILGNKYFRTGTACEGLIKVRWDPTGQALAASCLTMQFTNEVESHGWDTTLSLNRRLLSLLETGDDVQSSLILTSDGQLIVSPELGFAATSDETSVAEVSNVYNVSGLSDAIGEQSEKSGAFATKDGKWVVRYHRIGNPDWILVDLISRRDLILQFMRAPALITLLLMASLLFQVFFVGAWIQRRIVTPIRNLQNAFSSNNEKREDESEEVSDIRTRTDEIGALANQLAATSDNYNELINDLEDRVQERTEKYQRASEAKSEFLANMSHEIRTPMNGILGMAELLVNTKLGPKQKIYADTIHSSGSALLTILNDILDFSKIEAGKLELDPHPFDMRQSVEEIATLLGPVARDKKLELVVRYDPKLPTVALGDAGRIRQILTNLVGNALKFTHEGHVLIDVSGSVENEQMNLHVAISDTGIGIPHNKTATIFEQFTQSDNATTRKFGGTGLGLAIAKRLIEEMGGEIGVESELGHGSTFWFTVSLPTGALDLPEPAPTTNLSALSVLVIDDLEINRRILLEQLASWDVKAEAVPSGQHALARLAEFHEAGKDQPLILLDYHMPEMDGLAFAEKLRAEPHGQDIEFIVLSSASDDRDVKAFKSLNALEVLTKPVPMEVLRKVISTANGSLDDTNEANAILEPEDETSSVESGDRRTVLVADDNQVNRMVIEHMFDHDKYALEFAENGRIAVDMFRSGQFDLVLMDISMPEMDGMEATKAIRSIEAREKMEPTPILALTAHAMADDAERFINAGMDDYLAKPVSGQRLKAMLDKWAPALDTAKVA